MASVYGYITVANLENFMAVTLDAVSAAYTDTVVEAIITLAERIVNTYKGTSYTGTIPDDVVAATTTIAKRLMKNQMIEDGFADDDEVVLEDYITSVLETLLSKSATTKYDIKIISDVTDNFWVD